jgi:hypothetical protein
MNIPVKRLNNGITDYFPMSVLDSVFLNRSIEVKNTIGGLHKGDTLLKNTSLQNLFDQILCGSGSDYDELINGKVDKEEGKGLSTCDFTEELKTKLESAITEHQDISGKVDKVEGKKLSSNDFTDEHLDKLNRAITSHQDISGKVDKVSGKGLSSCDFTEGYRIKLDNLRNYNDSEIREQILTKLDLKEIINTLSPTSRYPVQSKALYPLLNDIRIRLANLEALFIPNNYIAADVTIVNNVGNSSVVLECDEINLDTTEE